MKSPEQIDLFPQRIQVQQLDPKAVAGSRTRVQKIFAVTFERESTVHQVFLDKHGWYCAEHGPQCRAVREVTARSSTPTLL